MTRVSLTDPDRTRAMVEEDSLNVEALLRRMAARLTDMADQLHAGAAGEQDVMGFFAEGDPFRRYKAAVTHAGITAAQDGTATAAPQAGTTAAGFPERESPKPAGSRPCCSPHAEEKPSPASSIHVRPSSNCAPPCNCVPPCRPVRRFPSPPVTKKAARGG